MKKLSLFKYAAPGAALGTCAMACLLSGSAQATPPMIAAPEVENNQPGQTNEVPTGNFLSTLRRSSYLIGRYGRPAPVDEQIRAFP